ncbi:microsomal glutathione S-transferase 1-like [Coccinella septempunctata]|uniref:microsomal glutathione S-transferase 1-like n=1 Tax=Coccinella septempunctata TaxID=41139 RepID=UPI001D077449|nr:microsomal glutathione S-transferase 1-like [Coccinella septempunctata]
MASNNVVGILTSDPLYRSYFFYCSILILKMMLMSSLTGMKRMIYGVFINPEDTVMHKVKTSTNEKIERVRRAHLNDVENIPLFFVSAFIYCLTGPSVAWATLLFKTYTWCRILHTIVYAIKPLPQPSRMLVWVVGYAITGYMALSSLFYFM